MFYFLSIAHSHVPRKEREGAWKNGYRIKVSMEYWTFHSKRGILQ